MGIRSREQASVNALLTDYDTNSAYYQAYQTLYANVRAGWQSESTAPISGSCSLAVTGAVGSAEQESAASNLAIVAAKGNTPTILVDADLRTSGLSQRFGSDPGAGLTDLLADQALTAQKVHTALKATFVPGLLLLPAGSATTQGTSLLLSPAFGQIVTFLQQALAQIDNKRSALLVFHCPSVLSGADAAIIASQADQTLLCIVAGQTTRAQAREAQEHLLRANARVAGVVLLNS